MLGVIAEIIVGAFSTFVRCISACTHCQTSTTTPWIEFGVNILVAKRDLAWPEPQCGLEFNSRRETWTLKVCCFREPSVFLILNFER